ncbi:hypothetical protein D3C81_1359850 [compost metagenome]
MPPIMPERERGAGRCVARDQTGPFYVLRKKLPTGADEGRYRLDALRRLQGEPALGTSKNIVMVGWEPSG